MKILLFGRNGQVGWELERTLAPLGEVIALDRGAADFARPETLPPIVADVSPDVVVNAVAYTAVDRAESEPELARTINTRSVEALAMAARRGSALFVHYSTDYVFDGAKPAAYDEDDPPMPRSVYGVTKREGELAIAASGCRHFIFRTSWVHAGRGRNFIRTVLRLAAERDALRVVADQRGAPTSAALIASVTAAALGAAVAAPGGMYHLAAAGETTWHGLARYVLEVAQQHGAALRAGPEAVAAISTEDYPTPAARPANSRLDTTKLQRALGIELPDWRMGARQSVELLLAESSR